ncbi:cytochrome c3 family protein [Desulfosediminicola flagellatus]|uniref:cytochrome c3 family protein n=1 Tax=Desulfosediminicola flagellatus TaxID=2569541 RepID=UPI0010AC3E98|nr:cytochrome c3 family protein [Desulfosediminicola flagellatus]
MERNILSLLFFVTLFSLFNSYTQSQGTTQSKQSSKFQHEPFANKKCKSCHESGAPCGNDLVSLAPELCLNCHEKYSGMYSHSPSSSGECLFCHNAHESEYDFLLKEDEPDICYACHEQIKEKMNDDQNSTHTPAVDNCTICHTPHVSDTSSKLLKKNVKSLCTECHFEEDITLPIDLDRVIHKHRPVESETSCLHCHAPHATFFDSHLLAEPLDLCLHCHDKEVTAYDGATLVNMKEILKNNTIHHGPIKEKNCSGCHSPHGSDFYRILLAEYPKDFYTDTFDKNAYNLCFNCHESAVLQERETTTLTNFRDGKRNLHYLHINKSEKGRTCRACHEIHASNQFNHIRESVPYGKIKWPLKLQYEAQFADVDNGIPCNMPNASCVKSGGSCVACHNTKFYEIFQK